MDLTNIFEVLKTIGRKPYSQYVDEQAVQSISLSAYDSYFTDGMIFKQYKNLEDAVNKIEQVRMQPKPSRATRIALDFVSDNMYRDYKAFSEEVKQPNSNLENVKEVSDVIITNIKSFINLGGMYEKDRLIVTEDNRGIFDFGLASSGLYRPIEFFSQQLLEDIENGLPNPFKHLGLPDGVVDAQDVEKVGNTGAFKYFNKKNYNLERRQRGTTKVYNHFSNLCYLRPNKQGIVLPYLIKNPKKVFNGEGKIRLKYASNNKKSYVIYQKKADSVKYVDIFVPINFLTADDPVRVINLLPAYLIANALEEFGINARISAMRTGTDNGVNTNVSITVKDYTESTKQAFNEVFMILATRGLAGSFFAFFKVYESNINEQGVTSDDTSSAFDFVAYDQQGYMNELMQRYKNWIKENEGKDFVNTKVVNDNFQFGIAQRRNGASALTLKELLKQLHFIFYQFYYYLDYLSIEFLPIQEFVKQVYLRLTEDEQFRSIFSVPTEKSEIQTIIKKYTFGIMAEKYKTVTGGSYGDSIEQENLKYKTFKEKTEKIEEAIKLL